MRRGDVYRFKPATAGILSARRLAQHSGQLSPEELWGVDEALMTVLGLT